MNDRRNVSTLLAAALLSAALSTAVIPMLGGSPKAQTASPPAAPAQPAPPQPSPPQPAPATAADMIALKDVPFHAEWAGSPHAKSGAEAFTHWNKERVIPAECAQCHSTPGFQDYLGADGSAPGVVNRPAPIGTVITCVACHNSKTRMLASVTFPSGLKVDNLGTEARCMICHQGRESTVSVNKSLANQGDDAVSPKLQFINVHYRAAGATLYGTMARGAYEYAGKSYAGRFEHRAPYNRCVTCHDPHTVAVNPADCGACHREVTDKKSLHLIRTSKTDYDGNGNIDEGMAQEIEHLRVRLLAAIVDYAKTVAGKPIVYDDHAYPYFFVDSNNNGVADKAEARFPNKYNAWTPRMLKAAYNYQFVSKDPGAFAHNPVYTLQVLHDSLSDLGAKVKVDLAKAKRP
jgi:hypothetical protein